MVIGEIVGFKCWSALRIIFFHCALKFNLKYFTFDHSWERNNSKKSRTRWLVDVRHCSCLAGKRYCDIWVEVNEFEPNTWCGQIISSLFWCLITAFTLCSAATWCCETGSECHCESVCRNHLFWSNKCSMQLFSDCADIVIKLIPLCTILSVGIKRSHTTLGLGNVDLVEQKLCCVLLDISSKSKHCHNKRYSCYLACHYGRWGCNSTVF